MLQALLIVARHIALAHDRWRFQLRRRPLSGEVSRLEERVRRVEAENELIRRRILRIAPRRRPHYRPFERLDILWHRARYGLSIDSTAHAFAVTRNTILNWELAASRELRSVRPRIALNRLPDLVSELTLRLKAEWPEWGTRRIAGTLAKLGMKASRSTVQRILKRRPPKPVAAAREGARRLTAKHPNHVWIMDFTRLNTGLRTIWVGAVIDAYSRKVLSLAVAPKGADSRTTLRLLRQALRRFGAPIWVVSDQGPEFTAGAVKRWLRQHGIGRRYGAVGRKGSISLIERFWRSMKSEYARGLLLYRPRASIERQHRTYVRWYNRERPHQGLDQRTPDQVFFRRRRKALRHFESGRLGVHHLGGDRRLPVLRLSRAA